MLDATAGGGSIPFEALRLGIDTKANDLNPVSALILRATVVWPMQYGRELLIEFVKIGAELTRRVRTVLSGAYPDEGGPDLRPDGYLWARTVTCPYCEGLVPLSPNWRLAPDGTGVKLKPQTAAGGARICRFEIVKTAAAQSAGTVSRGTALCPFPDCGRVIDGDEIKRQAQAGGMGEQLYAIVFKRRVSAKTKTGRIRETWERGYRAPRAEDDVSALVAQRLADKLPAWEAHDIVPTEPVPAGNKTQEPMRYGAKTWRDMFSPRQLYGHCIGVEVFRELLAEAEAAGSLGDVKKAAFVYLSFSLDKMLNFNARSSRWDSNRESVVGAFDRHDFSFKWSYAEMAPLIAGLGYDWAIRQTAKCIEELVVLARPDLARGKTSGKTALGLAAAPLSLPSIEITNKSADALDHLANGSIDAVVIDPPYSANVMFAELSDFFYVWLKRTAGYVYPALFRRPLSDKDNEAVANVARFKGQKGASVLAERDYQVRMAAIFAECRRVVKPTGIMTVMFTHKDTAAWDALTTAIIEAGFVITASWPISTESSASLHIRDKAAATSTIFLACRPRPPATTAGEAVYWEDVEPQIAEAVRRRMAAFDTAGLSGVDLYIASFGPALETLSRHWPLRRGRPLLKDVAVDTAVAKARKRNAVVDEASDPFAVTPEDALAVARREVKSWRLRQLTHRQARTDLDALTAWFVLAWDTFRAATFPYDEALSLARICGLDLDRDVVGTLCEKKASSLVLWNSTTRAAKNRLGAPDGSRAMIDALHHLANAARSRNLQTARELFEAERLAAEPRFLAAIEAVLEVLPVGKAFTGIDEGASPASGAAADFDALENLRRLALVGKVDEPKQLGLWTDDAA